MGLLGRLLGSGTSPNGVFSSAEAYRGPARQLLDSLSVEQAESRQVSWVRCLWVAQSSPGLAMSVGNTPRPTPRGLPEEALGRLVELAARWEGSQVRPMRLGLTGEVLQARSSVGLDPVVLAADWSLAHPDRVQLGEKWAPDELVELAEEARAAVVRRAERLVASEEGRRLVRGVVAGDALVDLPGHRAHYRTLELASRGVVVERTQAEQARLLGELYEQQPGHEDPAWVLINSEGRDSPISRRVAPGPQLLDGTRVRHASQVQVVSGVAVRDALLELLAVRRIEVPELSGSVHQVPGWLAGSLGGWSQPLVAEYEQMATACSLVGDGAAAGLAEGLELAERLR